jgi:SAM-dependent methyltransferase
MATAKNELIGMADIARMAGVSRATVGNWKARRPDEFPTERDRTPRGPLYDPAEVAAWLATRRTPQPMPERLRSRNGVNEDLWRVVDAVRGTWRLRDAAPILLYALSRAVAESNGHLDALVAKVNLLDPSLEQNYLQLRRGASDQLDGLLDAVRASNDPLDFVWGASNLLGNVGRYWDLGTPAPVADLIAGLVGPATTIYDPTVGTGQLAARVARKAAAKVAVYGQDTNPVAAALATSLLESTGFDSHISLGDTITDDQHRGVLADVVVAHPPFSIRVDQENVDPDDIRWMFGPPRGDTAWLQIGLHHLAPGGRMAILVPPRVLFRQGSEGDIIRRIVRQNLLRAVIALPERSMAPSAITPAVLLLGDGWGAENALSSQRVLMISDEEFKDPTDRRSHPLITPDSASQVIKTVRAWLDRCQEPESDGANLVTYDDITNNDWVLLPHRYRQRRGPRIITLNQSEVLEGTREELSSVITELAARVQQYVDKRYDVIRTAGEPTTLGALEDVTFIRGVFAQDVLDEHVTSVTVIEPADLRGLPVASRSWNGEHDGTLLEAGDVLIKLSNPDLGDSAMFTNAPGWGPCVAGPDVGVIRTGKLATISAEYLAAWCASSAFRNEVERLAVGTTRKHLRFADLAAITITVPDHEAQQVLGERARAVADIELLHAQLAHDLEEFTWAERYDIVQSVETPQPPDQ